MRSIVNRILSTITIMKLAPMNSFARKRTLPVGLGLLLGFAACYAQRAHAQFVPLPSAQTTPMSQRNAMNLVLNQLRSFQNTSGSAGSYVGGGYGMLAQQFQAVRDQYNNFKTTLNPQQANVGANQIAELDSGLDIIAEAFSDYQAAVANGQNATSAYNNMRQVLNQALQVWMQEFKRTCNQLRVGW
jgi:hypothetical protein